MMDMELTRIRESERERDRAALVLERVAAAARRRRHDGGHLAELIGIVRRAFRRPGSVSPDQAVARARARSTTSGGGSARP